VLLSYLSLLRSELKVKILLSLLKSAKKLADLKSEIENTRDTTILHILYEFETSNLITKNQKVYELTALGTLQTELIKKYMDSVEVLDKFKDFWLLHKVSSIPTNLLFNLNALKDAEIVQANTSELGVVHQKFVDLVQDSKRLYGTAPIFHPDFILLTGVLLSQGCKIELIVTTPVLEKIFSLVDIEDLARHIEGDRLKIYTKEDLEPALTVTEKIFSLGLFLLSGKYDDSMDLLAFSKEAIAWGEGLFAELLKSSETVDITKYSKNNL
jgi:predicted transcriptional regulator